MAVTRRRWLRLTDHTITIRARLDTAHPPKTGAPEYRASQCEITDEEATTTVRLRPGPVDHDLPVPHTNIAHWHSVLVARTKCRRALRPSAVIVSFNLTLGRRQYLDGEGLSFESQAFWCHLWMRTNEGGGVQHLADGTSHLDEVPRLIADMADELTDRAVTDPTPLPTNPVPTLVLTPTVAAVLLHELVGHVAEDLLIGAPPLRVGPDRLAITAHHPRMEGVDDEGIPVGTVPIVADGMLSGPVLDRRRARDSVGPSAGIAQASWHQGPPRARCTHLWVAPGEPTDSMLAGIGEAVLCVGTSGAELVGRHAVLGVSAAVLTRDGQAARWLRPFHLGVDLDHLAKHLVAVGDDVRAGRAGLCVRGEQALPTRVWTPTLVLEGVQPRAT
jgi:predicted Zn-dependent protease